MAWWLRFPKSKRGGELVGIELVLDPDNPPEPTSFAGMKNVYVKHVEDKVDPGAWYIYKVMMTEQDINRAIDAMLAKTTFTFKKEKDDKFATVELWKQ